jgi:tetratricopeptide (TPR) repeat protein
MGTMTDRSVQVKGELLKQIRTTKAWTQRGLADKAKVDPKTVIKAERGGPVDLDVVGRLSKALGIEPGQLMTGYRIGQNQATQPTNQFTATTRASEARNIVMGPYERRDLEEARELVTNACEAEPTSSFVWAVRALVWALYLHRGWVGDENPRTVIGEVRKSANRALTRNSKEGDAHFALGILAAFQGSFSVAEQHYAEALKQDPLNAAVVSAQGHLMIAQNCIDDAMNHFQESAKIDPQNPIRHFDLAVLFAGRHDYERAWEQVTSAIDLRPNAPIANAITLTAWLAAAWKGNLDEMHSILNRLQFQDRDLDEAVHMLMWCGLLRRKPREVIEIAEQTSSTYIEHRFVFSGPVAWHTALAHHLEGNANLEIFHWDKAKKELGRRLEGDVGGLRAHYRVQLATTLAWMGQTKEAQETVGLVEEEWNGARRTAGRARELAGYYAAIGDAKNAVPALERALAADSGPGGLTERLLASDPWWDNLRDKPEFLRRFSRTSITN